MNSLGQQLSFEEFEALLYPLQVAQSVGQGVKYYR